MEKIIPEDQVLTRSMVSERIWALYKTSPEQFKQEVLNHFALGYPGWKVVRADYKNRTIFLRDER